VDGVSPFRLIDPDNDQPATGLCLPDHLVRLPARQIDLDAARIREHLVDLLRRDSSLRMVRIDVPMIGGIPDDRPIVHPRSIYMMAGVWIAIRESCGGLLRQGLSELQASTA
jgi:hypothetical protein